MAYQPSFAKGIIDTESGPISVRDFSKFLYYFRAAYVEALFLQKEQSIYYRFTEAEVESFAEVVAQRMFIQGYSRISSNANLSLPDDQELYLTDISRRNPIDVVFSCVGVALAAAVIISGGEMKWDKDGFKVKLPPLGKGIAELKKALSGNYERKIERNAKDEDSNLS